MQKKKKMKERKEKQAERLRKNHAHFAFFSSGSRKCVWEFFGRKSIGNFFVAYFFARNFGKLFAHGT